MISIIRWPPNESLWMTSRQQRSSFTAVTVESNVAALPAEFQDENSQTEDLQRASGGSSTNTNNVTSDLTPLEVHAIQGLDGGGIKHVEKDGGVRVPKNVASTPSESQRETTTVEGNLQFDRSRYGWWLGGGAGRWIALGVSSSNLGSRWCRTKNCILDTQAAML